MEQKRFSDRRVRLVNYHEEIETIRKLGDELSKYHNASNSFIITVSTDYSSIVGQILRHQLSDKGEICQGFGVDVPYPDEIWDGKYISELEKVFNTYSYLLLEKCPILVEAAVIRGGNYSFLTKWMRDNFNLKKIVTTALYENTDSVFKSDYVGRYYLDASQDLTFWWEKENNHWK